MSKEELYIIADRIAKKVISHYFIGIKYEIGSKNIPYAIRTIAKEYVLPELEEIMKCGKS